MWCRSADVRGSVVFGILAQLVGEEDLAIVQAYVAVVAVEKNFHDKTFLFII